MNISLIDVGTTRAEINEPLGIEIMAGVINRNYPDININMECFQFTDGKIKETNNILSADIIGISTKLYSLERVNNMLSILEKNEKEPLIILGDLLATFAPEYFLNKLNHICVIGEGEEALKGIIDVAVRHSYTDFDEIKSRLIENGIPNLAFNINDDIVASKRKLVDLNTPIKPYRYFLDDVIKVRGIVRLESSRGCPWGRCSFCAISAKYGYPAWRPYPIDHIIDELTVISDAGGLNPYFTDEDFIAGQPQRLYEFNEKLQEAKEDGRINPDLKYYVNMTVNDVIQNKDLLTALKKTGLREIFLGLESGANEQMKRYSKMASVDLNLRAISILKELDFVLDSGFIMFDPEMTLEDLIENMEFIKKCGLVDHDASDIKRVRIEPGTELAKRLVGKDNVSELDVNSLTYDYNFREPLVQRIWDLYQEWEAGSMDVIYKFQGHTRGEINSELHRIEMKHVLGKFRENDYNMLYSIINLSKENLEALHDNKFIEKYINQYESKRNELLSYIQRKWNIW